MNTNIPLRSFDTADEAADLYSAEDGSPELRQGDNGTTPRDVRISLVKFIDLITKFKVPLLNPCLLDEVTTSHSATGHLGRGGQFLVDRVYESERYVDTIHGNACAEINLV
jgi:hypothetical protein